MTKRMMIAAGVLAIGLGVAVTPYTSNVQRVEHIGIPVDSTACVMMDVTTAPDGGPLSGTYATVVVGDASVSVPTLPDLNKSYICYSNGNASCFKQGGQPTSCGMAFPLPADQYSAPIAFMPEADGGKPVVRGLSRSGTANIVCCPINPTVLNGR